MGTSLTGLTPATTYDALIKVGDNGPLSATAKVLSDGLGNDSPLAMSTTNVGVGTSSPLALLHISQASANTNVRIGNNSAYDQFIYFNGGNDFSLGMDASNSNAFVLSNASTLGINDRLVVTTAGNVGIGTSSPNTPLSLVAEHVGGQSTFKIQPITSYASSGLSSIGFNDSDGTRKGLVLVEATGMNIITESTSPIRFSVNSVERGRWTTDGLCFNGDTAAANALDDYEEGTWTPTLGTSGGTGSASYSSQLGTYTKIGRVVVVHFFLTFAKNTLSGGTLQLLGLPFTSQANIYPESTILIDGLATTLNNPLIQMDANSTVADLIQGNGSTGSHAGLNVNTYLGAGTMNLRGTITYFV